MPFRFTASTNPTDVAPKKQPAGPARKPNSVPAAGCPAAGDGHSSEDAGCPASLATYPGARTGRPQTLLYLVLHRVGFAKLLRSPGELVRSYRTVSPLPRLRRGGLLSVALSFTSPRLHVMEHPALRCSDFPPEPFYSSDRLVYSDRHVAHYTETRPIRKSFSSEG